MSEAPKTQDRLTTALQGVAAADYGDSHRDHTLEIYKTYLEMADRVSARREKANAFFLAVNTALIALLAKDAFREAAASPRAIEILVPLTAGVLCYLWYRILRSYRDLNSAKFKVIHAIELRLPVRPYDAEWESVDRGKNPKLYLPFTHVEMLVPWLFMGFHALLAASTVQWADLWDVGSR